MSKTVHIQALPHLHALLASSTWVILDFYADWCGPCHQIAPFYEQLSKQHSAEGAITFGKVNVDQQRDVAQRYQISAMPTFVVIKDRNVVETIRGANPPALKNAVAKAVEEVAAEKRKQEQNKKNQVEEERKETQNVENETSVSGGYTLSKGSNWKMSLN